MFRPSRHRPVKSTAPTILLNSKESIAETSRKIRDWREGRAFRRRDSRFASILATRISEPSYDFSMTAAARNQAAWNSMSEGVIILIPARMAATRLPGKPLADVAGRPMIVHVLDRAVEAGVGPVFVATDSEEV